LKASAPRVGGKLRTTTFVRSPGGLVPLMVVANAANCAGGLPHQLASAARGRVFIAFVVTDSMLFDRTECRTQTTTTQHKQQHRSANKSDTCTLVTKSVCMIFVMGLLSIN
jgi:hypothetical protein